jgi:hypothetical protein
MPGDAGNGKTVHAVSPINADGFASADTGRAAKVLHINAPLGEVTLNFVKATGGLAHGAVVSPAERQSAKQAVIDSTDRSFGNSALNANAQDSGSAANDNAGGNGNGLALGNGGGNGLALGNGGGNGLALGNGGGNGLALGNGGGNGLALGNGGGNGLALGNGNGNAIGVALGKGKAKGKL